MKKLKQMSGPYSIGFELSSTAHGFVATDPNGNVLYHGKQPVMGTEQPAKLRLDGYGTILLDAHGVFLTDYQNLRKAPGFNYGECQLLDKVEILFKLVS